MTAAQGPRTVRPRSVVMYLAAIDLSLFCSKRQSQIASLRGPFTVILPVSDRYVEYHDLHKCSLVPVNLAAFELLYLCYSLDAIASLVQAMIYGRLKKAMEQSSLVELGLEYAQVIARLCYNT